MFQFTIKSLVFLMTVVATYALVVSSGRDDSAWKCFAGIAMLAGLVGGKIAYDANSHRKAMMRDEAKREKLPE
jgi:hypothetical protein